VARIETLEMSARAELLNKAMRLFRTAGVDVDLYNLDAVLIRINGTAITQAIVDLQDVNKRRSDRRSGIATLLPENDS
jgi:hypothetical protein